MNFIVPFYLPLLIDKGTTLTPVQLLLSYYLKRGGENEFYSLWSYLSPQTASCLPSEVAHSTTLPLFSLLNTKIGNEFYCPCPFFSPQHHPIVTLLLLSLSFAALKKEKINFTAPSPP